MTPWTDHHIGAYETAQSQEAFHRGMVKFLLKEGVKNIRQVNDLTMKHFRDASTLRIPPLPMEILRLIGFHVADDQLEYFSRRGGRPAFVSTHLSHFRLVSRAFADAGRGVMTTLFRKDPYYYHRILHLPSKLSCLPRTERAMEGLGLHRLIDTISVHPFAVPIHDITELEEIRTEQIECAINAGRDEGDIETPGQLRLHLRDFLCHCAQQEQFLANLESAEERAILATMLTKLPHRLHLDVRVFEYWRRDVLQHSIKPLQRASCMHWKLLPLIAKVVEVCDIASMTLTADSSMFQSMSIEQINSTFGAPHCLSSLTSLRLEMSRLDFLLDKTWTNVKPLEAAPRFNAFLACAVNLEELVLDYNDLEQEPPYHIDMEYVRQWPPPAGNSEWLASVLQGLHWTKLENFELHFFRLTADSLLGFLDRHKNTLTHVTLAYVAGKSTELELKGRVESLLSSRDCEIAFYAWTKEAQDESLGMYRYSG